MRLSRAVCPIAIVAGFIAAYPLITNSPIRFPPVAAADRLFFVAIPLALVVGVLAAFEDVLPANVRFLVAAISLFAVVTYVTQTARPSRTPNEYWTLIGVIAAVLIAQWWFLDRALRRDADGASTVSFIALIFIAAAACLLISMSGSLTYATLGVPVLVVAAIALLKLTFAGFDRRVTMNGGTALAIVGLVGTLLAVSIEPLFVNVTITNALLIAAAAPIIWLSRDIPIAQSRPKKRAVVRLILTLLPILISLSMAGVKAYRDYYDSPPPYDAWQ